MAGAVRISDELLEDAQRHSRVERRSVTGQVEHWARIGKCVEENPELSYTMIKDLLIGLDELDSGEKTEYQFG